MISPATAQQLGPDYRRLRHAASSPAAKRKAGVFIVPGHADNSVTLHLGYGRSRGGKVGTGPGFNAYLLRTSAAPWMATGLQIAKTGKKYCFRLGAAPVRDRLRRASDG